MKCGVGYNNQHYAALGLTLVMSILFMTTNEMLATNAGTTGLVQRVFVVTVVILFTLTAVHLRQLPL
jgi:hypothetical protein